MRIKQLRCWLSDISDKQKYRRSRSEGPSLASTDKLSVQAHLSIERKGSNAETSPTSSREHLSPRTQIDDLEAGFSPRSLRTEFIEGSAAKSTPSVDGSILCAKCGADTGSRSKVSISDGCVEASLSLQQNPSTDPTVATRDDFSATTSEDTRQPTASWVTTRVSGGSWNAVDHSDPDLSFDYSAITSFEESGKTNSGGTKEPVTGEIKDYYSMKNPEGRIQGFHDMGQVYLSHLRKKAPVLTNVEPAERTVDTVKESSSVHAVPSRMHTANIFGNKTLTAGTLDFICSDGMIKANHRWLIDDETGSCWSNDSSSHPSIVPGALDSKMAQLFLDPYPVNEATLKKTGYQRASYPTPRRKTINPSDFEFLNRKGPVESHISSRGRRGSSLSHGYQSFGRPKTSFVERRKKELEELWAENKPEVHVKKVKWGVCQSTGTYKKKIVIDVQKK